MHPAFLHWWKSAHAHSSSGCGQHAHHGHASHGGGGGGGGYAYEASGDGPGDYGGGAFGVRRPLRFLAWKLGLDERQMSELAKVLDELKTERAQGDVDARRTLAAFADAVAAPSFDEGRAGEGAKLRVESAERLRAAVLKALGRIHGILNEEQRAKFAYLIRTGTVTL